jgi:outer membrane protein assembly factor BamB
LVLFSAGSELPNMTVSGISSEGELLWSQETPPMHPERRRFVPSTPDRSGVIALFEDHEPGYEVIDAADGRTLWTSSAGVDPAVVSRGSRVDILAYEERSLVAHDPWTGEEVIRSEPRDEEFIALAGLSNDPVVIAGGTREGSLFLFDEQLRLTRSVLVGAMPMSFPDYRDANGDGFEDVIIEANGPFVVYGPKVLWRVRFPDGLRSSPQAADLDGDGRLEVLAAEPNAVRIVEPATGRHEVAFPIKKPLLGKPAVVQRPDGVEIIGFPNDDVVAKVRVGTPGFVQTASKPLSYAAPVVLDLDHDGDLEVLVMPWDSKYEIQVYDYETLEVERTLDPGAGGWPRPTLAKLADGDDVLVLGHHSGDVVAVDVRADEIRWKVSYGRRQRRPITVADLDGDRAPEAIVVGSRKAPGGVTALDAATGEVKWEVHGESVGMSSSGSATAVVGENRRQLVVVGARDGLAALDATGAIVWHTTGAGAQAFSPIVIDDLDGDGRPEALAGFLNGWLWVVDAESGELRWKWNAAGKRLETSPVPVDVDGDGIKEVIVGGHDRYLTCLRSSAKPR